MESINAFGSNAIVTNTTSFTEPIMYMFSAALLLGSSAFQTVLGYPGRHSAQIERRSVDDFINSEEPIALERLICNIGSNGCEATSADPGVVIASPSRNDPPYYYTWTRDSALVFKYLVDRFTHQYDAELQTLIEEYIVGQAKLQSVSNPSGSFSDGKGLGEPKFEADLTPYTGSWGRPQRDGPPLRAIAMISYANWLIDNGYSSTAKDIVWPVVRNDLTYVAQYWNQTGFDLWEEVSGSSFFTTISQHRSLIEGGILAAKLGESGNTYSEVAPQVLCFLQRYWIASGAYIDSNINTNDGRTGKDANSILASIHNFDAGLKCDASTFQPCSDKALANHKAVVDSFRFYNINKGIPQGEAVAVGRYSEDVYYNGNPWYLATLAAAEQLYDALYVWQKQGYIEVTDISSAFFKNLSPGIEPGTYESGSETFQTLVQSVSSYADDFVNVVAKYTPQNGALAEQFSKDDGSPLSARDLTWSYASFLSASDRRAGIVPPSWANGDANNVPGTCTGGSARGSYESATATAFPPNQTPKDGTPTETTTPGCPTATEVAVTFRVKIETQFGDTIKLAGEAEDLGLWDPANAVPLDASEYTSSDPVWKTTINLPGGKRLLYKYINVGEDGSVTWEGDPNRMYTVPKTCDTSTTKSDAWQ